MCLWPRMTPGSVSTSRSRMVSRCFCAKLRTCACANLMSSRSRLATWPMARSTSLVAELEGGRRPLVELLRQRAHGGIALGLDLGQDRLDRLPHLGVGRLDGAGIHAALEMTSHGCLLPLMRRRSRCSAYRSPHTAAQKSILGRGDRHRARCPCVNRARHAMQEGIGIHGDARPVGAVLPDQESRRAADLRSQQDIYQCPGRGKDCRFAEQADGTLERFGADCGRLPQPRKAERPVRAWGAVRRGRPKPLQLAPALVRRAPLPALDVGSTSRRRSGSRPHFGA